MVAADPAIDNLKNVDHIVVLMMENRSFDQMLGYLKLEGGRNEIDGLTAGLSNTHAGKTFPIHHLPTTILNDAQDPNHDEQGVKDQLANANGGFVSTYARTNPDDPDPSTVMGYYNDGDVPLYDHLAREFAVCDRWFSSVPGATWPNRLYAVTGRADKSKNNKRIPLYNLPSIARQLDAAKVSWRWYAHERVLFSTMTTLKLCDGQFRQKGNHKNFKRDFFNDAKQGKLPAVSWIDPNFVDFGGQFESNDDHAPADVLAGQELALKIYHALVNSPNWAKTLLVITYDEHGGFYDHVPPPAAEDDDPNFLSFGVRVPALVVSPFIPRGAVSHTVYDHASILKTILLRFCRQANGGIPDMGRRVTTANHLGALLTEAAPRPATPMASYQRVVDRIAEWHKKKFGDAIKLTAKGFRLHKPNDFQRGWIEAQKKLSRMEEKARKR
ncbi:MAG: alkaline phosphatase family protein [Blastocatellia bacterium]